jgi:hypothetical protein
MIVITITVGGIITIIVATIIIIITARTARVFANEVCTCKRSTC